MIRELHIADSRGRDATVVFYAVAEVPRLRMVTPQGGTVTPVKVLKATLDFDLDALLARHGSLEAVAEAIAESDEEVDMESAGKRLRHTRKLYVDRHGAPAYTLSLLRVIRNPDGSERERREVNRLPGNVNATAPLRWSGRLFPKAEAARRFLFSKSYQIRHINGVTFDFLYRMAQQLERSRSLALIGSGARGTGPILLSRGGQPYRGMLEGRTEGERYTLILHLTDMEIKTPQP